MTISWVMHGAAGRMGKRIVALAQKDERFHLAGAITHSAHKDLQKDAGEIANIGTIGVPLSDNIELKAGQIVIDFSLPVSHSALLQKVNDANASLVCGTTGLSDEQIQSMKKAASSIPILYSPNMSVGVNLLFLASQKMAQWTDESFDIEVLELHHRLKRDAPSGTALHLADLIAKEKKLSRSDFSYDRSQRDMKRPSKEIGMQVVRGGDITGEHTVYFCNEGERIELTHRATSRDIFARGALRAAAWLSTQPAGFYSMFDLFELA